MKRFKATEPTDVFKSPGGAKKDRLQRNETFLSDGAMEQGFVKVDLADGEPSWIREVDFRTNFMLDESFLPLDEKLFVSECIVAERLANADERISPWYVYADFLIARALIETNLKNVGPSSARPSAVGPFRMAPEEWNAFLTDGGKLAEPFAGNALGYLNPFSQIHAAAWTMHALAKAISAAKPGAKPDDPFIPSYLDVFHAHLTNSAKAAVALYDAMESGGDQDLSAVLNGILSPDRITALFGDRARLQQTPQPTKAGEFVKQTRAALNQALVDAFKMIETNAPEELLKVKHGEAPWLDGAEKEMKDGVTADEVRFKDRILDYFNATDHGRPNEIVSWCGAFVAHCIKSCGNAAAAKSVPAGSAAAINWKSWGAALPLASKDIPRGAVVVLSPETGSNHVGFFDKFLDEATVQLLGGNQTRKVGLTPFKRSSIAAIQWLDLAPTDENSAPSTRHISKEAFDLIVEFEVTSKALYTAKLQGATWPGKSSGITIGIGYDVGHTKASVFESDWKDEISVPMLHALRMAGGVVGPAAQIFVETLRTKVSIPWDIAIKVHTNRVIPRWIGLAEKSFANAGHLNEDCLGALVSLIYNRGTSFSDDPSRAEMVAVRACMASKQFNKIPGLIRDMKRLWPDSEGLQRRREREAAFFEAGLAKMAGG